MNNIQKQNMKNAMQTIFKICWEENSLNDNCKDDCPFAKICNALNHSEEVLYSYPCEWNWITKLY